MKFQTFAQLNYYLDSFIPDQRSQAYSGDWGLNRVKKILHEINNPQENYQVIHITGTSGKGSTANFIAKILSSQNLKIGLNTSPHLHDFREAFVINNRILSKTLTVSYFNSFLEFFDPFFLEHLKPTFFELITAFSFYVFDRTNVNVAVVEVGVGGLLDSTNVVKNSNKICVFTPIDLDHKQILGQTITEIANQKSGIIQFNNPVFSANQKIEAKEVIFQKAEESKSIITEFADSSELLEYCQSISWHEMNQKFPIPGYNFKLKTSFLDKIKSFTEPSSLNPEEISLDFFLPLMGSHQVDNLILALKICVFYFSKIKKKISLVSLDNEIRNLSLPARSDLRIFNGKSFLRPGLIFFNQNNNSIFWLDGAHNPAKFSALTKSLNSFFPARSKFVFVLGFLNRQDLDLILKTIQPFIEQIIFSDFKVYTQVINKKTVDKSKINQICEGLNIPYEYYNNPKDAILRAEKTPSSLPKIISGSFYFLSNINRYFPWIDTSS